MHERFTEGWRAVVFVVAGLEDDYPNSTFEVRCLQRGIEAKYVRTADDIAQTLEACCKHFPHASAYYDPEEPNGRVAEIHCHCSHEKSAACCKNGGFHRTRVNVSVVEVGSYRDPGWAPAASDARW
jgi:hypothetical protein